MFLDNYTNFVAWIGSEGQTWLEFKLFLKYIAFTAKE